MSEFKEVVDQYYPILYKIGRLYSNNADEFDDLYQEMLIQLYRSMEKFRGEAKLSTWIYRVALNTALTCHRAKSTKKREVLDERYDRVVNHPDKEDHEAVIREKQIEMLYDSIKLLRRDERSLIILHLEGKQYDEIADIIGISKSNVGVKLMRIKKRLEKILKEKGYERIGS